MSNNVKFAGTNDNAKQMQEKTLLLFLLMAAAFIVHIVCAIAYPGYEVDMNCFSAWSYDVFEHGISEFYKQPGFTDYPPGYMYILWVVGGIRKLFGLNGMETGSVILLKLPAILCDLGIGYVIYKVSLKYTKPGTATLISAAFLFNPAVIINSSTWGQVDSVFTLCVLLMCYFVTEKKLPYAYFIFAIGILIKPQALIFTPVLIFGIIEQVFLNDFDVKRMLKELGLGLLAILCLFLLAVPFGLSEVLKQYVETLGSYEYASVNAYNFWAALGYNWTGQDDTFIFMSFKNWGTLFIVLTVAVAAWLWYRCKEAESKYYFVGAFIVASVFTLSVRMHERYMYPALALLLVGAAVKRQYRYFVAFGMLSLTLFMNEYHVLFHYDPSNYDFGNPFIRFVGWLTVLVFAYMVAVFVKYMKTPRASTYEEQIEIANREREQRRKSNAKKNSRSSGNKNRVQDSRDRNNRNQNNSTGVEKPRFWSIKPSDVMPKWTKWDSIIVAGITVIYACIAFYNLGDMEAPQTYWKGDHVDQEIVLDFGKTVDFENFYSFLGYHENRKFEVSISDDGENWSILNMGGSSDEEGVDPNWMNICSVFCWNKQDFAYSTRYLKFVQKKDNDAAIMEMMFYDRNKNVVTPVNTSDYPELFDEQDIFEGQMLFNNSTYFDEIYHARTAYEMVHGMYNYEWTHPPFGKLLISIGISIFGMCPFGWRFMGTFVGVLMIPVIYLLGRRLTKKTWLATVTTLLLTFDFMHFAQTRISTIDVYVTFFIMLMYYFMLKYYKMSFYDTPLKKTFIPLGLSGICMGLACASKWTGIYGGMGLAVIFAIVMIRRYMEYRVAKRDPAGETEGISHKYVIDNYSLHTMKTLVFCIGLFVIVPLLIYAASYVRFDDGSDRGYVEQIIENQKAMYGYHANLEASHPYESAWYQWPLMERPILYYVETLDGDLKSGISSFGNPLVWWIGILAFIYMIYLVYKNKDRIAIFLIVGYLAEYLPWMLVKRCTFIYHYFPSVPFLVMMIGYGIYRILKNNKPRIYEPVKNKIAVYVVTAARVAVSIGVFFAGFVIKKGIDADYQEVEMISVRTTIACLVIFIAVYIILKAVANSVLARMKFIAIAGAGENGSTEVLTAKGIIGTTRDTIRIDKVDVCVYAGLAVLLFGVFYPVLSGYPATVDYGQFLKWIGSWALLF